MAAAIPEVHVADCQSNILHIESLIAQAEGKGVEVICFPELCVTGYTCADLFLGQQLIDSCENAMFRLLDVTRSLNIVAIVGLPLRVGQVLVNAAAVVQRGKILGIVPKSYIPNYKEFYEKRWFTSGIDLDLTTTVCAQRVRVSPHLLFRTTSCTFGIEICEDLWAPVPPSSTLALQGAEVIFNLSATDEVVSKHNYLSSLLANQSARLLSGYVYASCGFGESSTDLVFAGNGMIFENGRLLNEGRRFEIHEQLVVSEIDVENLRNLRQTNITFADSSLRVAEATVIEAESSDTSDLHSPTLTRHIDPHPFVPQGALLDARCDEVFAIQVAGLARRIVHVNARSLVIGISGGLDSTLALLVCTQAMDKLSRSRSDIIAITMPGFGTTDRTYHNAISLMQSLGVTIREISIRDACIQHFKDIGHDPDRHDVTYENSQARERTQILMDVANQEGGIVVGTGDLSELALGWATYNGDHMSNYGVNASIPKTLVKHLVTWVANTKVDEASRTTLLDIVDTPISPELIPANENGEIKQKTEDLVGPYELHDFFIYHFMRGYRPSKIQYLAQQAFANAYDTDTIHHWLHTFIRRFFGQQFKRSCLPDGPKVGTVSLSPRGDWRMPSDATASEWLKDLGE